MKTKLPFKSIIIISFISSNVISEMYCDTTLSVNDLIVKCKVYDSQGKLRRVKRYRNGKFDGVQEEYYASGKLEQISFFKNGCEIDSSVSYHENGKLLLRQLNVAQSDRA